LPWKKKTEIYLSRKSDNRNALNENEAKMPLRTTFFYNEVYRIAERHKNDFLSYFLNPLFRWYGHHRSERIEKRGQKN